MTETSNGSPAVRRWNWWHVLLIVSLALNLLIGAAAATRHFIRPPTERMASTSYLQLVPRKFFAGLDRARREELLGQLREFRDRFREGQQKSRQVAGDLADALDAAPYEEARVRAVLNQFNANGAAQIALGGTAAMEFIRGLTPEERTRLAQRIRERAKGGRK